MRPNAPRDRLDSTRATLFLTCLAAALAACGADKATGPGTDTPKGATPAQMTGLWRFATASPGSYYDNTGHFWNGSGGSSSVTLSADGHVVLAQLQESAAYGCRVTDYKQFQGTVVVHDTTMTLYLTHNTEHGEGTCGAKTFDAPLPNETDNWAWKIIDQPAPDPRLLWLVDVPTGADLGHFAYQTPGQ